MDAHHDDEQTTVPHFGRPMVTLLEMVILFDAFVGAFGTRAGVVGRFPCLTAAWCSAEESRVTFGVHMHLTPVFGRRAGILTLTDDLTVATAHFGAAVFEPMLGLVKAGRLHRMSGGTDGNAIAIDGVALFLQGGRVAFVQVNEGFHTLVQEEIVEAQRIMRCVQERAVCTKTGHEVFGCKPGIHQTV